jgi:hypothetical protein
LPDPAGWEDLASRPDLVHERLQVRIRDDRFPFKPYRFPLPKPGKGEVRVMSWIDPYDEVALRALMGRCTPALVRSWNPTEVCSYEVVAPGPRWWVADHRTGNVRRRATAEKHMAHRRFRALAVLDIRNYYASISLDVLTKLMLDARCPEGAVRALINILGAHHDLSGIPGLPIGFDGSGVLANAYLAPADLVLRPLAIGLVRYTDDTWAFLDHDRWDQVRESYATALKDLRLTLHPVKSRLVPAALADEVVHNADLDYLTGGNTRSVPADEALDLLTAQADLSPRLRDGAQVHFALGALRRHQDARGIGVIENAPDLLDEEPTSVGKYLCAVAAHPPTRRRLDDGWLAERASRSPHKLTLAGQVQAARAATVKGLAKTEGRRFLDLATDPALYDQVPLRAWAAAAWSASRDWKLDTAIGAIEHLGEFSVRRAFTNGARGRPLPERMASKREHLLRVDPDLAPSVVWAFDRS